MNLPEEQYVAAVASVDEFIGKVHNQPGGHRGAKSTWEALQHAYGGCPISFRQVDTYVKECDVCQKLRAGPDVLDSLNKALPLYHARAVVHADVLTLETDRFGNKVAFVFINAVTKYCMIYPAPNKEPEHFAAIIIQYMATVGLVDLIWCDQGGEFTAETSKLLLQHLGTGLTYTLTARPQANAPVERLNQEILKEARLLMANEHNWHKWSHPTVIALIQLLLNTRVHSGTQAAPVDLTFGNVQSRYLPDPTKMKKAPQEEQHKALYRFNRHLESVQRAAMENLRLAQDKRLQKQPENIVQYSPGDLVLHRRQSTHKFQERKLAPPKQGPYRVIRQQAGTEDTLSNTVLVRELNADVEHSFHHSNLTIFAGSEADAKKLQKIDKYETTIQCIRAHRGNVDLRTSLEFEVCFEDGEVDWLSYAGIQTTEALETYAAQFIWGKRLLMTAEEYAERSKSINPGALETLTQAIMRLPDKERPKVADVRYYSLFAWNNRDWDITEGGSQAFGKNLKGKEPLIQANVMKVQRKRLEIQWPALEYKSKGKRVFWFTKDIDLHTYLTYTCKTPNYDKQVVLNAADLRHSLFQETLYEGNNLTKVDEGRSSATSTRLSAMNSTYLLVRPDKDRTERETLN